MMLMMKEKCAMKYTHDSLFLSASNVITPEYSTMSSHNHVALLIQNLLDTPLHVYNHTDFSRYRIIQFIFSVVCPQYPSLRTIISLISP
jgi:hypothetical protein